VRIAAALGQNQVPEPQTVQLARVADRSFRRAGFFRSPKPVRDAEERDR